MQQNGKIADLPPAIINGLGTNVTGFSEILRLGASAAGIAPSLHPKPVGKPDEEDDRRRNADAHLGLLFPQAGGNPGKNRVA